MLSFLFDLLADVFGGGDASARRVRSLRRKLVRFLKSAPISAFTARDPKHLGADGAIRSEVRRQIVGIGKGIDSTDVLEWEDLCARFLERIESELPGVEVQLPPDEPRMAYAGDKSL